MNYPEDTTTMTFFHAHGWRLVLAASGVALLAGAPMHPSSDSEDPLRKELAVMTADSAWVPGHSLIVLSTVLLATGLWMAHRRRVWPTSVQRTLGFAAVAVSAYVVETVAHLAAVIDSDRLAAGDAAPVAFGHIGLASVLYPVTGWALVFLALAFGRVWRGWRRVVAVVGAVAGLLHAFSVPLTILFPDTEFTPVFAGAAMSIAVFTLGIAVAGAPRPVRSAPREVQRIG